MYYTFIMPKKKSVAIIYKAVKVNVFLILLWNFCRIAQTEKKTDIN